MIEVRLRTGRRNQIRLQARLRGHTLIGERRYVYGPDTLRQIPFERQALHAHRLSFRHPARRTGAVVRGAAAARHAGAAGAVAALQDGVTRPPASHRLWLSSQNGGVGNFYEALKARVAAQALELRLDARPGGGERALLRERALQKGERRFGVAAHRMDAGGVVARERIVGAEPDAAIEALERDREHRLRLARVAELLIGRAEPRVQLDKDAVLERMIGVAEEIELAL